ncbi:forkhead box protein R1 [Apus apus]|uniref:forkhead box protein R1 n=1 Tax=Apus apus TaxID=8895 RepID=UPI0021F86050|nr:forkhead box protein R1 [Apus apus]
MGEELKFTITTEECLQGLTAPDKTPCHRMLQWHADPLAHECLLPGPLPDTREPGVQPHLWMWVNPNLVCSIPGSPGMDPARSNGPVASVPDAMETSSPNTSWDYSDSDCFKEDVVSSSSEAGKLTENEDALPAPQEMLETPEPKAILMPQTSAVLRPHSGTLQYPKQTSTETKGGWPRPPLNYCLLITLALCNSTSGSLTVQQIYQFTRSCFKKTTGFVCGERNRKSRLWKLTAEGRRRFQKEALALPKEALDLVRQSMSKPDLMTSLFSL